MWLGAVSKALFMSIVTRMVLIGGAFWLNSSSMCCLRFFMMVEVEWTFLKPYLEGSKGICGYMRRRMIFSKTLEKMQSKEIGL